MRRYIPVLPPPLPDREAERLEALRRYRILDTPPERAFDDITGLASFICGTPTAVMSLVDDHRQWFKSKVGISGTGTPRSEAFCAHTINQPRLLIVEDARRDERFAGNPSVTGDPHIRFYAGAPLLTSEGLGLGSLCVIDPSPRNLSTAQKTSLEALARLVVTEMELRLASSRLAEAMENIKTLSGLLPMCAHCKGIRNDRGYYERVETFFNTRTGAEFSHGICPGCLRKHFPDLAPKT